MRISDWSSDVCSSDLMTLYLVPMSYRGFKELQFQLRHNFDHLVLREGEFRSFGDGITVYVRAREDQGQLAGIVVHDQRDPKRTITLVAERGALVTTPEGPRVVMANGSRQERQTETGRVNDLYFERYTVRSEEHTSELQSLMRISYAVFC